MPTCFATPTSGWNYLEGSDMKGIAALIANGLGLLPDLRPDPKHHAGHSKSRRTVAQDKRDALKRRNVARHKAHVAGRRP